MRQIVPQLTNHLSNYYGDTEVSKSKAYPVKTYQDLLKSVARLAYINRDYLLFYRGQENDYLNKASASSFYPSIYRGERVSQDELQLRFDILESSCNQLCDLLDEEKVEGYKDVRRRRHVQWSILQHYEVCATPLLDFTQSLRVACSFALNGNSKKDTYVFVFGLPYMTNRISINTEEEVVNVRLLSICPPDALRPYYQEGYLIGTEAITNNYESKSELDFNRRLIAKYKVPRSSKFWGSETKAIPIKMLYPPNDKMEQICITIKDRMNTSADANSLGRFLQDWSKLENKIMLTTRKYDNKVYSVMNAIQLLENEERINHFVANSLHAIRKFRNTLVHNPSKVSSREIAKMRQELMEVKEYMAI